MLDTNIISHIMRRHPAVLAQLTRVDVGDLCVSVITAGELLYGLAKRPSPSRKKAVDELLARLIVMPWTLEVAEQYGALRALMESTGRVLTPLDMQIAAHALSGGLVLVTADMAFAQVEGLSVIDWTVE